MNVAGPLVLAAAAGLNPWVTLLIVCGLVTFTRHAEVTPALATIVGLPLVVALAVALGVDVVASKAPRTARFADRVNRIAAPAAGALVAVAVPSDLTALNGWEALPGAALAAAARFARDRTAGRLNRPLRPLGRVAASILADLVAAVATAAVYTVKAASV